MAKKTDPRDAEGWQKVIRTLRAQGHKFPHGSIAKKTGVPRQSVRLWEAVPIEHLAKVSELCGMPKARILPVKYKLMQELFGQ